MRNLRKVRLLASGEEPADIHGPIGIAGCTEIQPRAYLPAENIPRRGDVTCQENKVVLKCRV